MNPKNSQDLFNKIRSQFANIRLGDENGAATANPADAVFFEFEFREDADTFGAVSISLADGENMKVYYNRDLVSKIDEDSRDEWYAFLKELKDFAVEHQLTFDVRDITKNNLTKQDYENLADTNKTVNIDEMSEELNRITKLAGIEVKEGLTGTAKRSYENLDKTRLIIRHSGSVDETVPGARSRQIESLYIENEDGERFKYPITHLAGARAMTRHVANGGRPHDEFGEHIIKTSEDIAKLNSFSRFVSNKDQLNDSAGDIIEQTKLKLENLRMYMKNLSKQGHYETASKDFKTADEVVLDDVTANTYKDKFTMRNLDARVEEALPLIHKIMSELEASDVVTIGKGTKNLEVVQAEYEILGTMEDMMAEGDSEQEVMEKIANFVKDEAGEDHVDKAMEIIKQAKENNDQEMTFEDMINKLKGKKEDQVNEQPEHEITVGDYTTKHFYMCGSAQTTMKKHADKDGAEELTRMQDMFYKMEKEAMDAGDTNEEQKKKSQILYDKIMAKAKEVGIADEVDEYMKMHLDSMLKNDPKLGFGRTDVKEEQVNELEPDDEPIDAPVQPPVDHGAVVQSFLNDPDSKLVLRKDDTADKMLKTTKFTNKNTMLSSILSDIASRLLTKSGEDDRVANFASRVADEMEQENSATFKPTPDYMKNKKIAIQLAKRYIDDYKKMQSDPDYGKEVRMEPGEFSPKKDLKGKAKEQEAFENWVNNVGEATIKPYVSMYKGEDGKMVYDVLDKHTKSAFKTNDMNAAQEYLKQNYDKLREYVKEPKDEKDREEKLKALQDIQMDPNTAKDPEMVKAMMQRKKELMQKEPATAEGMGDKIADMAQSMSKDDFMAKADELGLSQEEAAEHYEKMQGGAHAGKFEGNMFAQAVQKAKAAGMKAGDTFKVGDKEYTLKDAIELAGLQLEEFFSEEEIEYDNQIDRIKNLAFYQ